MEAETQVDPQVEVAPEAQPDRSSSTRLKALRNVPRIGSKRSLSMSASERAVRAPFEGLLTAFLDFLYSDSQAGVTGPRHAQVLFRRWLELSITHDRVTGGALEPYLSALLPFYPDPSLLKGGQPSAEPLRRKEAEAAMREPFERVLRHYLRQIYSPEHLPGIRDEGHAQETFVTFCQVLFSYQTARGRD